MVASASAWKVLTGEVPAVVAMSCIAVPASRNAPTQKFDSAVRFSSG